MRTNAVEKVGVMFGYRKKNIPSKGKTVFVEYGGFRTHGVPKKNELCCIDSLNCDCTDGCIKTGIGAKRYIGASGDEIEFRLENGLDAVYSVDTIVSEEQTEATETFVCVDDYGSVYQYDEDEGEFVEKSALGVGTSAVTATDNEYDMRTIFVGDDAAYYFRNGGWSRAPIVNTCGAVCFCKNRVFVAKKPYTVVYSAATDPWQFGEALDECGSISLYSECGSIVGMLAFEEKVVVFLERGITVITPDGAAREFKVERMEYSGGKILGKTAGVCGNSIIFMAMDGIYKWKNGAIQKIGEQLKVKPIELDQVCNHAVCGEDFLIRYTDNGGERRIVVIRENGTGYYISDFDGLNEFNNKPLCRVDGFLSVIDPDGELPLGEEYYFATEEVDFGLPGRKYLKNLYFEGDGIFRCYIWQGDSVREEEVVLINGWGRLPVGECGERFRFTFYLDRGTQIRKMRAEVAVAR